MWTHFSVKNLLSVPAELMSLNCEPVSCVASPIVSQLYVECNLSIMLILLGYGYRVLSNE